MNKYFSITYDMSKLSDDEQKAVIAEASSLFSSQKAVCAGWENDVNGWISVDDELPTKHDVYTVYCPSNLCLQNEKEKIQIASFHPDTGWNSSILITHWQPLPKPPKE